ncbi:MAG: DUF4457 domain-containing protein, partial [Pseudomonadota bacterium]|nr:DUF4457 domain-containing protein [Pseudomonadota bacterium]
MPEDAAIQQILPRREPVQERSRKRFERILEEATGLIDAQGVDAVAMKEIAAAAEISIASLYQYFPDKAAIIATLADRFYREGQTCVQSLFATVADTASFEAALLGMVDSYYGCFLEMPGAFAIWQATQADRRLQLLDEEGAPLPLRREHLSAAPADLNAMTSGGSDPRTVDKLIDASRVTTNSAHMWLAPWQPGNGRTHTLTVRLPGGEAGV